MLSFIGSDGLEATFMTESTFDREKYVECLREYALSDRVQQHPGHIQCGYLTALTIPLLSTCAILVSFWFSYPLIAHFTIQLR